MAVNKISENSQKYPEKKDDKNTSEDMNIIRFEMLIDEVGKKLHYNWGAEKKMMMSIPCWIIFLIQESLILTQR